MAFMLFLQAWKLSVIKHSDKFLKSKENFCTDEQLFAHSLFIWHKQTIFETCIKYDTLGVKKKCKVPLNLVSTLKAKYI